MKTIKIIIFLLIMNVLIFSTIGVFATDTTATLNVNNSEVKPGDKIKVTLNVNCTEGIGFIGTKINYDSSILTLESQDINNKLINYGTDKLELFSNSSEKLTNITACTFVFKVNENATAGTIKISTTNIEISDINNQEYTLNPVEKTINIKIENTSNQEEEPKQNEEPNNNEKEDSIQKSEKENKKVDNTTISKKTLPQTGDSIKLIAFITLICLAICIIFYIKNKKYKNI